MSSSRSVQSKEPMVLKMLKINALSASRLPETALDDPSRRREVAEEPDDAHAP